MITSLLLLGLSIVAGLIVRAYALPIVRCLLAVRNWAYIKLTGEDGNEHKQEIQAAVDAEIARYRANGDSNEAIAVQIFFQLVIGLPEDIIECTPFIPAPLADKIAGWSDALRNYKIPAIMISGVGTLGLMNYSFLSGANNKSCVTWLLSNAVGIGVIALIWKLKHPLVRRFFYSWMGVAIIGMIGMMAWLTIQYHLYDLLTFRIFLLAVVSIVPAPIVAEKSWRKHLFGGRWLPITVCWVAVIVGTLAASWVMSGNVNPLLEVWAAMALIAVTMLLGCGVFAFAGAALCWGGVRGSAAGLRLLAAGIRRLR